MQYEQEASYPYQAPPTKRGGASYSGSLMVKINVRLYMTNIVPRLSQAADGRVVYASVLVTRCVPVRIRPRLLFFLFFPLNNWFTGIYRRTFTLLSDQGLVAKSIG